MYSMASESTEAVSVWHNIQQSFNLLSIIYNNKAAALSKLLWSFIYFPYPHLLYITYKFTNEMIIT